MTDLVDTLTDLFWKNYYEEELDTIQKISDYLGGYEQHDNTFDNLSDRLYEDISDLLNNGNQEMLFGTDSGYDEAQEDGLVTRLHDVNPEDNLLSDLCDSLARRALGHEKN